MLSCLILAPTFGDWSMLPQTQAFIFESYRWRPVNVGGAWMIPSDCLACLNTYFRRPTSSHTGYNLGMFRKTRGFCGKDFEVIHFPAKLLYPGWRHCSG